MLPCKSRTPAALLGLTLLFTGIASAHATRDEPTIAPRAAALQYKESRPSGETIVRWSENIFAILTTLDSGAPAGLRLNRELAMVHIAMHDAANAVDEKFERYALDSHEPHAKAALSAPQPRTRH
jgi:hypothetical protein